MTHVHSTAMRPGAAAGGDQLRAPISTRVVVDASGAGGGGAAAAVLSDALTALGLAPEAPDSAAEARTGAPAPAAY
ncbi:hypothetical protein ACWEQC_45165, partial [Streptomyces shenzhenensis]